MKWFVFLTILFINRFIGLRKRNIIPYLQVIERVPVSVRTIASFALTEYNVSLRRHECCLNVQDAAISVQTPRTEISYFDLAILMSPV